MTDLSWDHSVRGHLKGESRSSSSRSISRPLCSSITELLAVSRKALEERRSELSSAQGSRHGRRESRVLQSPWPEAWQGSSESRHGIPRSSRTYALTDLFRERN